MAWLPILLSNLLLSILSITNLGLISSMVGFLLDQKHNVGSYTIKYPDKAIQLHVLPENIWLDQGHTSNGVAGYGFFLGLIGLYVAWRQRNRSGKGPSKSLLALCILLFLAVLFTLSALIFVFLVTNQTNNQSISEAIVQNDVPYPADKWTPETWFKAVRELPLADSSLHSTFNFKIRNMEAWRYMLIPIFLTDIAALAFAAMELMKQRKGARQPEYPLEK